MHKNLIFVLVLLTALTAVLLPQRGQEQQLICERILNKPGLTPVRGQVMAVPNGEYVVLAQAG